MLHIVLFFSLPKRWVTIITPILQMGCGRKRHQASRHRGRYHSSCPPKVIFRHNSATSQHQPCYYSCKVPCMNHNPLTYLIRQAPDSLSPATGTVSRPWPRHCGRSPTPESHTPLVCCGNTPFCMIRGGRYIPITGLHLTSKKMQQMFTLFLAMLLLSCECRTCPEPHLFPSHPQSCWSTSVGQNWSAQRYGETFHLASLMQFLQDLTEKIHQH